MVEHTKVSRKTTSEDRIAICPQLGCETIIRVKPLKFGFIGFGKYPVCKHHRLPLVYVDERIGEIVDGALSCLFDKAGLPPKSLLMLVRERFPEELTLFIKNWIYCITIGRGASIISSYMDSLSHTYLKQITKKQLKTLKNDASIESGKKRGLAINAIKRGIDEIASQYTRLLAHLRVHSEVIINLEDLLPPSIGLRNLLKVWYETTSKEETELLITDEKYDISLSQVKDYYDKILNLGTCKCLLGLPPVEKKEKKKGLSAFDRFSAYLEFWKEHLTEKFTKSDTEILIFPDKNYIMNIKKEPEPQDPIISIHLKGAKLIKKDLLEKYNQTKDKIFQSYINHIAELIDSLIKENDYPLFVKKTKVKQLTLFEDVAFIKSSNNRFEKVFKSKNFEALIYEIICKLSKTRYYNKLYIGYTGRDLDIRFLEHFEGAVRECVRANNNPKAVGYTKINQAIANSIIAAGWDIEYVNDSLRVLTGEEYFKFRATVIKSIKGKYIIPKIRELHKYEDSAHEREKYLTKKLDTVKYGLNEKHGGGAAGKFIRLPMYDIALMITMGKNQAEIVELLEKLYNIQVSNLTVHKRIEKFFGGWYEAQVKFLKPVLNNLLYEGFTGREIYNLIMEMTVQHQGTWFNDWIWGKSNLEYDIEQARKKTEEYIDNEKIDTRYFGIPKSQWISWAVENLSLNNLKDELKMSKKTLVEIFNQIGNSYLETQVKYRKIEAIKYLNKNWSIEDIYTKIFKRGTGSPLKAVRRLATGYFQDILFPDSTIEQIYREHSDHRLEIFLKETQAREEIGAKPSLRAKHMENYPLDLNSPFPEELIEQGSFKLREDGNIREIPKYIRFLIIGLIYKYIKEEPRIHKRTLIERLKAFSEEKIVRLERAWETIELSEPLNRFIGFHFHLIQEIIRRLRTRKSLSRREIISTLKSKDIPILISDVLVEDVKWNLKILFPKDFP